MYFATLIDATVLQGSRESLLVQPVLKAYPTHHSWIITAHISLGNLEKQWRMFVKQMGRTQQLLNSPQQKPLAPTYMLSALQVELTNVDSNYTSYKPLVLTATQLLSREATFDGVSPFNRCTRRSLLPLLGDALSWLMGTTTTKDVNNIKNKVNQLIAVQHKQQETLAHIIFVLNVTRYATQENRQHINLVMDAVERTHQDVTTLYSITSSLYTSLNYQQIVLHIHSILTNLRNSLYYMRQVAMHAMDYIDAATTGILSPHVPSVEDLRKMLIHIGEALPSTIHLLVSSEDTLYFYQYLCTHILIADTQFLILINVPIQDHVQQIKIYEVFNLVILYRNLSACYNINSIYLAIILLCKVVQGQVWLISCHILYYYVLFVM